MNILDYVKRYRPKMVDIWRVSIEAYPESIGPFVRALYDYDVIEDRLHPVDVPSDFKLPDPVRQAIVARPQRGSLHHDWWTYNWRSEPVIGRREPDDTDFSSYELSSIDSIHVELEIRGVVDEPRYVTVEFANDGTPLTFSDDANQDNFYRRVGRRLDSIFRNQRARDGYMVVDGATIHWRVTKVDWAAK